MSLRSLSLPIKVVFSLFLITIGIGYLFAILYLYLIDIEPHTKKGVGMVQSVIIKYYGQRTGTRLEAALEGAMGENLTPAQKREITEWIQEGATEDGFALVQSIFMDHCAICHSKESGMAISSLTNYEEVGAYTQVDMGLSIKSLVRVSHIHLFGISFIFMLTSSIFVLSEVNVYWRVLLAAIPFVAIWIDIGSWWFTKVQPAFAYTVIIGGILMGLSLAAQIFISFYEMWIKKGVQS
jgi:mono/diheme cytochrome c family protein